MDFPEVQNSPTTATNAAITAGITVQRNGVNGSSCTAAILRRRYLTWVNMRKTQSEHIMSELPPTADIAVSANQPLGVALRPLRQHYGWLVVSLARRGRVSMQIRRLERPELQRRRASHSSTLTRTFPFPLRGRVRASYATNQIEGTPDAVPNGRGATSDARTARPGDLTHSNPSGMVIRSDRSGSRYATPAHRPRRSPPTYECRSALCCSASRRARIGSAEGSRTRPRNSCSCAASRARSQRRPVQANATSPRCSGRLLTSRTANAPPRGCAVARSNDLH